MANENKDVIHNHYAAEATAIAAIGSKRWAYSQDSRRLVVNDAATMRYFWDASRMADTGGNDTTGMTYGAALIGSAGITGITPLGGSSGSASTIYNVMVGIKTYASGLVSGTTGTLAKFTSSSSVGNSIVTESGTTITVGGTCAVNTALVLSYMTSDRIPYSASGTITATSNLTYNPGTTTFATANGTFSGHVSIGVGSAASPEISGIGTSLEVGSNADNVIMVTSHKNTDPRSGFSAYTTHGTKASPTALGATVPIMIFRGYTYDGSTNYMGASFQAYTDGAQTTGNHGSFWAIRGINNGSSATLTEWARAWRGNWIVSANGSASETPGNFPVSMGNGTDPYYGFNSYYEPVTSAGYKYGAGSTSHRAAIMDFSASTGAWNLKITTATGAANAAATFGIVMQALAAGNVSIGGSASTSDGFYISSAMTGILGTSQAGIFSQPTFQSSATANGRVIRAQLRTQATSFTMAAGVGVRVEDANKGAGSTITTQIGVDVADQTQGSTNYALRTGLGSVYLGDNVTIERNTADDVSLTISNLNTGGDVGHAICIVKTGGSGGGDAWTKYDVTSYSTWSTGTNSTNYVIANYLNPGANINVSVAPAGATSILRGDFDVTRANNGANVLATISNTGTGSGETGANAGLIIKSTNAYAYLRLGITSDLYAWGSSTAWGIGRGISSTDFTIGSSTGFVSIGAGLYVNTTTAITTSINAPAGTALWTLENTSNTASSNPARLKIAVGGGTNTGDPCINYSIAGVVDWCSGPDNSALDRFCISKNATPGTNDYFTLDTSGNATIAGTLSLGGNEAFGYDQGSFTFTATGFTSSVTATGYYTVVGNVCILTIPTLVGVSNNGNLSLSGIPVAARPATSLEVAVEKVYDNGLTHSGEISIGTDGTALIFRRTGATTLTSFTSSGDKGIDRTVVSYALGV